MPTHYPSSDGVSRLTDLMRQDPIVAPRDAPPPVDPDVRRRRRRRGAIIAGVSVLTVAALTVGYVAYALDQPLDAATWEATAPPIPTTPAADIVLSPDGATAVSVSGADDYLGASASGIWVAGMSPGRSRASARSSPPS